MYNTIAGYKSIISAYHEPIDGFKLGEHPRVTALVSGGFNNRPPQLRFNFVWDVKKISDVMNVRFHGYHE